MAEEKVLLTSRIAGSESTITEISEYIHIIIDKSRGILKIESE